MRELLGLPVQHLDENFGREAGPGRVLTSDQQPSVTTYGSQSPRLGKDAALRLQLVLDEEGHHLGQADRLFLGVREAGAPRSRLRRTTAKVMGSSKSG
jgi:hypothetical protein